MDIPVNLSDFVNKIRERRLDSDALPNNSKINEIEEAFFRQTCYQLIHFLILEIPHIDKKNIYYRLIENLLKAGCKKVVLNKYEETPLFRAAMKNNEKIFDLLNSQILF